MGHRIITRRCIDVHVIIVSEVVTTRSTLMVYELEHAVNKTEDILHIQHLWLHGQFASADHLTAFGRDVVGEHGHNLVVLPLGVSGRYGELHVQVSFRVRTATGGRVPVDATVNKVSGT